MTTKELREKYLKFFEKKGHAIIPSASLIPENDPSVLFISAGMQPLVPYFLGEKHPIGTRLVDIQKCLRTVDFDNIGDNTHNTFFQMLGNWSLGDYFKEESVKWGFEFLTSDEWLGLDLSKLAFTVYEGDDMVPRDNEAVDLWKSLGVKEGRIAYLGEDNFWSAGDTGPCGPSSEIFYWSGDSDAPEKFDPEDETWVEIWNHVFMMYNKKEDGTLEELEKKNIDTGMGFERTLAVLNNQKSAYETDLFSNSITKLEQLSGKKYLENVKAMRIVSDHIRAAVMVISEGIVPSNLDQGYIVRRLIRRSIRNGRLLDISENFCLDIAQIVINDYSGIYPELKKNDDYILKEIEKEEAKFASTIEKGLKEFEKMSSDNKISGAEAFILFSTYGFPLEMTQELAVEKGVTIDEVEFENEMKKHQEASKKGSEQKFKGGLADSGEETARLHTATHLLQAALRKVLGDHVAQKGSNITTARLRFDFTHDEKLTDEQKQEVEKLVNDWIKADYEVNCEELSFEQAKKKGAIGLFEDKYGDQVKVYSIDEISCEMCGGPHAKRTGELGTFKIKKEKASSAGVRRIKAILE